MRNKTILIALALLAVSLTACGTKAPPYTVDDARRLLDAGVFDGDMMRAAARQRIPRVRKNKYSTERSARSVLFFIKNDKFNTIY